MLRARGAASGTTTQAGASDDRRRALEAREARAGTLETRWAQEQELVRARLGALREEMARRRRTPTAAERIEDAAAA